MLDKHFCPCCSMHFFYCIPNVPKSTLSTAPYIILKYAIRSEDSMKAFWYNDSRKNICGIRIRELRKKKKLTQKKLSIIAQLAGYDFITETAIIKSELGTRFIPDYEINIFAKLLETTPEYLLQSHENDYV